MPGDGAEGGGVDADLGPDALREPDGAEGEDMVLYDGILLWIVEQYATKGEAKRPTGYWRPGRRNLDYSSSCTFDGLVGSRIPLSLRMLDLQHLHVVAAEPAKAPLQMFHKNDYLKSTAGVTRTYWAMRATRKIKQRIKVSGKPNGEQARYLASLK